MGVSFTVLNSTASHDGGIITKCRVGRKVGIICVCDLGLVVVVVVGERVEL